MKILVTGAAGFIGYHLSKSLLEDGSEILGLDNLNNYYDPLLKSARLALLKEYSNFKFKKIDLSDRVGLKEAFKEYIDGLDIDTLDLKQEKLEEVKQKGLSELSWQQLLFTINFQFQHARPNQIEKFPRFWC